jgi:uncharacterized protein YndB with AHSA1/START domain
MTAPRPGDAFHLDLDGTVIAGRYIEVDPPPRLVIGWDRQGTDKATPTPALVEITLTPTGDGTNVKVQLSGLSAEVTCWHGVAWVGDRRSDVGAMVGEGAATACQIGSERLIMPDTRPSPPVALHRGSSGQSSSVL